MHAPPRISARADHGANAHGMRILIPAREVRARIVELGRAVTQDFGGEEIILIGVLKGALLFTADLARAVSAPVRLDFIEVSSYGDATRSSGIVQMVRDFGDPLEGRNVLLVEDIIDTGLTLNYLLELIQARRPARVEVAALLCKTEKSQLKRPARYVGFELEGDPFVVGCGMDYQGLYRNLDHAAVAFESES